MAKKLRMKQRAWLNSVHVVFASIWLGAAVSMVVVMLTRNPASGDERYAMDSMLTMIDDFVIIPAAIGSLLTGLLISWLTDWGFFTFKWVTVKWIATVAMIIFGTFWLGPWLNGMEAIVEIERGAAIHNATYVYNQQMNMLAGPIQAALLVFLVVISVLKPWKKWRSRT